MVIHLPLPKGDPMLIQGQSAPEITLPSQLGGTVSLTEARPALVVLFFYPQDDTETCTLEARAFSVAAPAFAAAGVKLYGVSRDSLASHVKFASKHGLDLPLLADEAGVACAAFGIWQEKKLFGRSYMGVVRSTFLIDGDGRIARVWSPVRLKDHVAQVLAAAVALPGRR